MSATLPLSSLRRLLEAPAETAPGGACHRCGAALPVEHGHVADLSSRSLRCVCPACHAALAAGAAEGAATRVVPRRYLRLPPAALTGEDWDAFEIPVGIAFFFHNSALGRIVASYPSPAGAVESLLGPEAWERVLGASPWTRTLAPDVEALLVRRTHEASECFVVPIDACYELAGRIRRRWSGFGGGPEARAEIESFFAGLRERSGEPPP